MRLATKSLSGPSQKSGYFCSSPTIFLFLLVGVFSTLFEVFANAQALHNVPTLPQTPFQYFTNTPPSTMQSAQNKQVKFNLIDLLEPHKNNPRLVHIVTLGRVLFHDRKLSANRLISCASCHKQSQGFDDISRRSIGFEGKPTSRNAMGLSAARFSFNGRFFWDERAATLEEQVLDPFFDPVEMGLAPNELVRKIEAQPYYKSLFQLAFGDGRISEPKAATALSVFVMAIGGYDSLFDEQLAKYKNPLVRFSGFSQQQNRGKFLFFTPISDGGAGCSSCHIGQHFLGIPGGQNNGLEPVSIDEGIGAINAKPMDVGKFRPPSLRNIALRAPFMHDGRFEDLTQVIDHYSNGISNHPNLSPLLKDETGKPIRLNISAEDKNALINFLSTLTEKSLASDKRFSNPFLSQ